MGSRESFLKDRTVKVCLHIVDKYPAKKIELIMMM